MQEEAVSFFRISYPCSQNGMHERRKRRFVYGSGFVKPEVATDGFPVEMFIIEEKSQQHIALLDVARAQNPVPRPVLVDRPFVDGNIVYRTQHFVRIAIVLHKDTPFFVFGQIHFLDDLLGNTLLLVDFRGMPELG